MVYSFGSCRLDLGTRELTRAGTAVHLSPKALEVLRLLLEARPNVVTKATLRRRLWPASYVAEVNLPVLVNQVRAAIGDDGRQARFIKTHHTIGYAFAAAAREERRTAPLAPGRLALLKIGTRGLVLPSGISVVGRDGDADVRIDERSVSQLHARILVAASGTWVEDLRSRHGTFVDGVRVQERALLRHGATLTFGSVAALYVLVDLGKAAALTLEADGH
jgi:DNA-binding winged helix-turn-helix (wHTH) protein